MSVDSGSIDQNFELNVSPPKNETSYFVGFCFIVFGITSLFAWNGVITNLPYFETLLASNPNLNKYFIPSVSICSMGALLLGNIFNLVCFCRYDSLYRCMSGMVVGFFGLIIIVVSLYEQAKGLSFFIILMVVAILMNFLNHPMLSGLYSDAGYFSTKYFALLNGGQAFSGFLFAVMQLVLTAFNLGPELTSLSFFFGSIILLVVSMILYSIITSSTDLKNKKSNPRHKEVKIKPISVQLRNFWCLFKKKWSDCLSIWLVATATLFMYPGLFLSVDSTYSPNTAWAKKYFDIVQCFLAYNVADFIARYAALYILWPNPGTIPMLVCSSLRFLNLIFLLLCNRPNARYNISPILYHDTFPIIFSLIFGFTHGHLVTSLFRSPYMLDSQKDQAECSTLFVMFLGLGLASGSLLSFIL